VGGGNSFTSYGGDVGVYAIAAANGEVYGASQNGVLVSY
jgi:hypothetical protein